MVGFGKLRCSPSPNRLSTEEQIEKKSFKVSVWFPVKAKRKRHNSFGEGQMIKKQNRSFTLGRAHKGSLRLPPLTPSSTPLRLGTAGMRSVCIFHAGDDRNWSHDPSSGGQRPGVPTTRRPGPRGARGLCKVSGASEGPPSSGPTPRTPGARGYSPRLPGIPGPTARSREPTLLSSARLQRTAPAPARTHAPRRAAWPAPPPVCP